MVAHFGCFLRQRDVLRSSVCQCLQRKICVAMLAFACCLLGLSSAVSAQNATRPAAQTPAVKTTAARGSAVEQLTVMLQSIDPYRPYNDVTQTIQVHGSTTMDSLAHGWASGFKQFHPQIKVEISADNSDESLQQLVAKPSTIAMVSRPVTVEELAQLSKAGLKQPTAFVVAREALSVYVHPSNPVRSISGEQLRDVFTSDTYSGPMTWSMLGATGAWGGKPLHIIARTEESGTQRFLSDFVFNGSQLRAAVSEHPSNAEVLQALSQDPEAIAICGYRSSSRSAQPLQLTIGATVIPCDDLAVLSGQYPLTRPMTVVIDLGQTDAQAIACQELVRFALCQSGQTQAIMVGLFPVDLPLLRAGMENLNAKTVR